MKLAAGERGKTLHFEEPLQRGTIINRPNRFVTFVKGENGEEIRAHCPATGAIGGFKLDSLPCLLSKADNNSPGRKTSHTMEAISIDGGQSWIGINQNMANRYVEELLRREQLSHPALTPLQTLKREPTLGKNRLDFLVNDKLYIEVKTPIKNLQVELPEGIELLTNSATGTQRMLSQVNEITKALADTSKGAMLLSLFMYDNPGFKVPTQHNATYSETITAIEKAQDAGLERWQLNLEFTEEFTRLTKFENLTL